MSEVELIEIFSSNLKAAIEDANMSQAELAKWSGLAEATISRYLSGERLPNLKAIINICNVLDCEFEDLIPTYELIE